MSKDRAGWRRTKRALAISGLVVLVGGALLAAADARRDLERSSDQRVRACEAIHGATIAVAERPVGSGVATCKEAERQGLLRRNGSLVDRS